jgi:hypothetical protein
MNVMSDGHDQSQPSSKPGFATSRRNFLAGAVLMGSTVIASRSVQAKNPNDGSELPDQQKKVGLLSGGERNRVHLAKRIPSREEPKKCNCFLAGTRIRTPRGEVPIERLQIGDLVTTVTGASKPIKWIGRMRFTRQRGEAWRTDVVPVKISRFALSAETPHDDLYLSPAHALYINGVLVAAKDLVNGRSITQHYSGPSNVFQYYHVELSNHDVIFAEGAAAETLQGSRSNRQSFDNADEYERMYAAGGSCMAPYAPFISPRGGRQELWFRIRSIPSSIYGRRRPLDLIRDEIAERAEQKIAA